MANHSTPLQRTPEEFIVEQIESKGVHDPLVLAAMRSVVRGHFVPDDLRSEAYADYPLPIGYRQTISQPYIVALMIEALQLRGGETVLEIGLGSGYAAAVLSRIAAHVFAIERIGALAERAAATLADRGYDNIRVRHANGMNGWPQAAPFDAILVSAGAPEVPEALQAQLKIGGRLVMPVGGRNQTLVRLTRIGEKEFDRHEICHVHFVPLIGTPWARGRGQR